MRKIIHLSDLHVGYPELGARLEELVTRLIYHKTPATNYVVVVTGDLVEDATRAGSYTAAAGQLDRLRAAGFTVLAVPGNHDYGTGTVASRDYVARFKRCFFGKAGGTYPRLDIVDGVAFLGLDSMAGELNWYDRLFAEGELGAAQLGRLERLLRRRAVRACSHRVVYLHHHPFHPKPFHQLKDSEGLERVLAGARIDVLLFGHNHDGRVWNGGWGIPRVYDGGTSTGKAGYPAPHRVIDLAREPAFDYDARL